MTYANFSTKALIQVVKNKLESLTDQTNWKAYKNGTVFLLDCNSRQSAKEIVTLLNKTQAVNAKYQTKPKTDKTPAIDCVSVEEINVKRLLQINNSEKDFNSPLGASR
jgi:hypothetical protein